MADRPTVPPPALQAPPPLRRQVGFHSNHRHISAARLAQRPAPGSGCAGRTGRDARCPIRGLRQLRIAALSRRLSALRRHRLQNSGHDHGQVEKIWLSPIAITSNSYLGSAQRHPTGCPPCTSVYATASRIGTSKRWCAMASSRSSSCKPTPVSPPAAGPANLPPGQSSTNPAPAAAKLPSSPETNCPIIHRFTRPRMQR